MEISCLGKSRSDSLAERNLTKIRTLDFNSAVLGMAWLVLPVKTKTLKTKMKTYRTFKGSWFHVSSYTISFSFPLYLSFQFAGKLNMSSISALGIS